MPKIIENLDERIIESGRKILMEEGYKCLTMRKVASGSSIALGTVYNYVSSKEELTARIMYKDWVSLFQDECISDCDSCLKQFEQIYEKISCFSSKYRNIWKEYGSTSELTHKRHALLISQIHKNVLSVFERFQISDIHNESVFICEVLLNAAIREDIQFEMISPFIEKIIR